MTSRRNRPTAPSQDATTAWLRLLACGLGLLLVAGLGCRPRWSKDGERVTYGARDGDRHIVAEHELATGRSRKLFDIGLNDGAMDMVRDPDQPRWVIVWADGTDDALVKVRTRDDDGEESEAIEVRPGGRNISIMMTEPVVARGYVFLTGSKLTRVDLETGETKQRDDRGLVAFPMDDGVGYTTSTPVGWEIGRLDPETLERTPMIEKPADCDWRPAGAPRYDPTGKRCAVAVRRGDSAEFPFQQPASLDTFEWAILIFEEGKLLTTVALEGTQTMGPIAWLDAVTIGATVMRPGDKEDRFSLLETNFSGSFRRETPLLNAPVNERMLKDGGVIYRLKQPLFLQPSPSPDGKTVAFTTAKMPSLPPDRGGLLLLRRDQKNRVDRVAFDFADK